jgi:hypothetical protein
MQQRQIKKAGELNKGDKFYEIIDGNTSRRLYTVTRKLDDVIHGEIFDQDGVWVAGTWLREHEDVVFVPEFNNLETAKMEKGDIVKTENGAMVITDKVWLAQNDKTIYKVQKIEVLEELLIDESAILYKIPLDELRNEYNIEPSLSSYEYKIFDISDYNIPEEKPKPVYTQQVQDGKNEYQVWSEGYAATGNSGEAFQLNLTNGTCTMWKGDTFRAACINAMLSIGWEIDHYYDYGKNTYWGCRFFDNEQDARKSFG